MESNELQTIHSKPLQFTKIRIIKNLSLISFSFLLFFTAYNGLSMLQSTMNQKQGIGTISQAAIYVSFMVSCVILPKYTSKKLGCKLTLIIAICLYIPYIAANFNPVWLSLIPGAVLGGIGASILWGSQCTYFNISALLYCTASEGVTIEEPKDALDIPSNATSIETLSVKDIPFDAEKNIYCKVIPMPVATTVSYGHSRRPRVVSRGASITTIKCDFDDVNNFTFFQRRSSGYEHGFFPPKEFLNDLKSDIAALQSNILLNDDDPEIRKNSIDRIKSFNALTRLKFITPMFFGLHGLLYHSSMIWSNVMSYYVLQNDNFPSNSTANLMENFSFACGAEFCNGHANCSSNLIAEPTLEMRYLLTGISVMLSVIALLLIVFFLDPLDSDKEEVTFSLDVVMATFNQFRKMEQIYLTPLFMYVGMEQGFYISDYTKSYIACAMGTYNVGLVTIFYGISCALSSILAGWLVRHMGRISIIVLGQIINVCTNVYLLLWVPDPNDPHMFFIGALLWGLLTGIFWSQLPALVGILFKNDEEAAFAYYYLCGAVGHAIIFVCSDQICTNYKIYIMLAVSTIGIIGYLFAERLHYVKNKKVTDA